MGGDMRYLLITLFLISASINASEFTWWHSGSSGTIGPFSGAGAACLDYVSIQNPLWEATYDSYQVGIGSNQTVAVCRFTYQKRYSTPTASTSTMYRKGTQCTDPEHTYNSSTGKCEPPEPDECEAKEGSTFRFSRGGSTGDSFLGVINSGGKKFYYNKQPSNCHSSCVANVSDFKCTTKTDSSYLCRGTGTYTGQSCSSADEVDFTDQEDPVPKSTKKDEPCVYQTLPDGTKKCKSTKDEEKEGSHDSDPQKPDDLPKKDKTEIDTDVKEETKPDGSKTTTKTDTATQTKCVGTKCTTTVTKTETKTETDANGNTITTGTCTGPACPDKNTNPDGDGDGFGDCTGGDCSDSGGGPLGSPELEEVPGFGDLTSAFAARIKTAPIMSAISGIGLNGGGSCSMSSTTTSIGTISASSFCDNSHWLDPLYYIFLAIHAFAAVRVFLSA